MHSVFCSRFCWILIHSVFCSRFCWIWIHSVFCSRFCWVLMHSAFCSRFCWIWIHSVFCSRFWWIWMHSVFFSRFCWLFSGFAIVISTFNTRVVSYHRVEYFGGYWRLCSPLGDEVWLELGVQSDDTKDLVKIHAFQSNWIHFPIKFLPVTKD